MLHKVEHVLVDVLEHKDPSRSDGVDGSAYVKALQPVVYVHADGPILGNFFENDLG